MRYLVAEFKPAFEIVLKHEGGYANNPYDAGGETKYGISKAQYPSLDIKNLSLDTASSIYKRDYWDKNRLGEINSQSIANFCLDVVVNHGRGPWLIQQTVNASGGRIANDGKIGPKTIEAINNLKSSGLFLVKGIEIRKKYIADLVKTGRVAKVYEKGLLARAGFFYPDGVAGLSAFVPIALLTYFVSKIYRG